MEKNPIVVTPEEIEKLSNEKELKSNGAGPSRQQNNVEDAAIGAVTVKPPAFEEHSAGKWFKIIEFIFHH